MQPLPIGLQPGPPGLQKPVRLVCIVVARRQVLDRLGRERRLGISVVMFDRRSAFARRIHRVHRIHAVLRDVHRHAHAIFSRLVRDGVKHVRPQSGLADNLDSVHAQRVPLVHNLPRAVRLRIPRIIVASPEGVHVHPRRNDLVGRDLFLLCHHPLGIVAPRMYVYPFWGRDNDPRNSQADGARQIVDEWHALGVDGIKIIGKPGLWPDVFHAIADEARKNGMGVAVHIAQDGVYPMNAVNAASEGASTIEHHYGYPESSFTTQTIQNLPPSYNYANEPDRFLETGRAWLQADGERLHGEVIQSLLATMRKTGFIMVPTFSIYEANRDVTRAANLPWHSTFTLPAVMDTFLPNPAHHASYFYEWTSNKEADWARAYRRWMEFVNDYKNQGGVVAVGSDTGFLFSLWGFGTIRELEMLEEAGFSPLEALHAATENGAKVVKNPEVGLVRPGYLADLGVLTENPLEDMKVFYGNGVTRVSADRKEVHEQCVKYTIRDGVIFDAQALLGDVRGMVSKAKQPLPPNKP